MHANILPPITRHHWLIAVVLAALACGVGCGPVYTSEAQLQVNEQLDDAWQLPAESGAIGAANMIAVEAYIENQLLSLKGVDLLIEAIEHPRVKQTRWYKSMNTAEDRLETMQEDLQAMRLPKSTRIKITFRGPNDQDPPVILDTVIDLFMNRYKRQEDMKRGNVRAVFDRTRSEREVEISAIRKRMADFRTKNDTETLDADKDEAAIEYEAMEKSLQNAEDRLMKVIEALDEARIMRQRPDAIRISWVLHATEAERTVP